MTSYLNTITHGDCLAILPQIPDAGVNFVLTDPPYVANYTARDGRTIHNEGHHAFLKPAFAEMYRVLEENAFCVSFYGWPYIDKFVEAYKAAGFRIVGHIAFPKRYGSGTRFLRYQHECAYLLAKGYPAHPEPTVGDVIDWTYSGNRLHPAQKPVTVLLPLVETFSRPTATVLDPYAGSGSSLLAAKMLGRGYIGIERDATYHAAAARRLAQAVAPDSSHAPLTGIATMHRASGSGA